MQKGTDARHTSKKILPTELDVLALSRVRGPPARLLSSSAIVMASPGSYRIQINTGTSTFIRRGKQTQRSVRLN